MKYRSALVAFGLWLATAGLAHAQLDEGFDDGTGGEEAVEVAEKALPGRPWYVSPMLSYSLADKDRGTDDGLGLMMSVGKKVTSGMTLEVTGFFSQYDADGSALPNNGTLDLKGFGVGAQIFLLTSYPNAYGILNVMQGGASGHPGFVADYKSTIFDSGIGYLWKLPVLGEKMLLRTEARYRMDAHNRRQAGVQPQNNKHFYDAVFNVGVLYPLGTVVPPPPPPAEPEVVETASDDTDGDGVPDDRDQCPDSPAGAIVDENGCEADADGDGVPDRLDQCPDTPAGQSVNDVGCPLDADGDGVPDDADECPATPAGAKVLANGCALKGDCRKPRAGEQVDANGCAVEQAFVLKGVKFEFDSERLTEAAKEILNQVAETLAAYPNISVELEGHTDNFGTDAYNLGLSERRAISVKTYLTSRGVDAGRMSPVGYGRALPVDNNDTEEGRENNRRVELRVVE